MFLLMHQVHLLQQKIWVAKHSFLLLKNLEWLPYGGHFFAPISHPWRKLYVIQLQKSVSDNLKFSFEACNPFTSTGIYKCKDSQVVSFLEDIKAKNFLNLLKLL